MRTKRSASFKESRVAGAEEDIRGGSDGLGGRAKTSPTSGGGSIILPAWVVGR